MPEMTIQQAMANARSRLNNSDARFDALLLAEHAFGLSKTELRLQAERMVDPAEYEALVCRRAAGEPLQYLLGEWEFFGLPFAVGPGVLIPRPETEMLVERALDFLKNCDAAEPVVFDLCAGTGCIGLSVAHHCPNAQVYLLERSNEAMPYLTQNAAKYSNAHVVQGDLFEPDGTPNGVISTLSVHVILSNPPYIATGELAGLSIEVQNEPSLALDGGADGLRFYRVLAEIWQQRLMPGGMLAMECGEGQARDIAALFAKNAGRAEILQDFNQIERVVTIVDSNS